jgi:hypothetical protein
MGRKDQEALKRELVAALALCERMVYELERLTDILCEEDIESVQLLIDEWHELGGMAQ